MGRKLKPIVRIVNVAEIGFEQACAAVRRTTLQDNPEVERVVREIIERVRTEGDAALLELGRRFDSPQLTSLAVPTEALQQALHGLPPALRAALEQAARHIITFHEHQKRTSWMDARLGWVTGQLIRPLDRVGIYVPGGTAAYPSTVLMTALPARVAGVKELVLCSPAQKEGSISPLVLAAAALAGVDRVFAVGGAQAVAAMAYGTQTVPAVDKIVGPGNVWVNTAKKLLWGVVDIDMLAGPSEVCIVGDEGANPTFVALDILTQLEHDPACAGYLITPSASLAAAVASEIERQLEQLPRSLILRQALEHNSLLLVAETMEQAIALANACAPEHLALMVREPLALLGAVKNAGAVLLGDYTPQTLGDYMAGPSHTLPTSGTARYASPLHVETFLKRTSVIYATPETLNPLIPSLALLARAEGFETHARAAEARQEQTQ